MSAENIITVGTQVHHKSYGAGIVVEIKEGQPSRCVVDFDSIGSGIVNVDALETILFS